MNDEMFNKQKEQQKERQGDGAVNKPLSEADELQLLAYMDDALDDEQRLTFEARLGAEDGLRQELEAYRRNDERLVAAFRDEFGAGLVDDQVDGQTNGQSQAELILSRAVAQLASQNETGEEAAERRQERSGNERSERRLFPVFLRAAAVLALLATVSWVVLPIMVNDGQAERDYSLVPADAFYAYTVRNGFEPNWVCETDHEFATTFKERVGVPMLLANLPSASSMVGLSYPNVMSNHDLAMLAESEGQQIIVFAERVDEIKATSSVLRSHWIDEAKAKGLNWYEQRVGEVVLYELSPLKEARFLPFFIVPDAIPAMP